MTQWHVVPSRARVACCALLFVVALAAPAAARPPPRSVSGFAGFGDGGQYRPYGYPATGVSNVTLTVAAHANGTSTWTEAATLDDRETVRAFRENATLRRAVADDRFGYRFDRHTADVRSRVVGDRLAVSYRLDGVVHRGPGGGVLLAPFAYYDNRYGPGDADVTVRAPAGYRVVSHPDAMAVADGGATLRWNATTGAGGAGVSPGLVTFAPAGAAFPGVRGSLAVFATYAVSTLRLGAGDALLFGVPFALFATGVAFAAAALGGLEPYRGRTAAAAVGAIAAVVGALATVAHYPATGSVVAGTFHPFLLAFALPVAAVGGLVGVVLHASAWRAG